MTVFVLRIFLLLAYQSEIIFSAILSTGLSICWTRLLFKSMLKALEQTDSTFLIRFLRFRLVNHAPVGFFFQCCCCLFRTFMQVAQLDSIALGRSSLVLQIARPVSSRCVFQQRLYPSTSRFSSDQTYVNKPYLGQPLKGLEAFLRLLCPSVEIVSQNCKILEQITVL